MRGWAIVCVWLDTFMIQQLGKLEQVPGFDDRSRCELIVSRWNRQICLGRYHSPPGHNDKCYYVALPFPTVLEVLAERQQDEDLDLTNFV